MKTRWLSARLARFNARYPEDESRRASILLGIQAALLSLLFATAVLVAFADHGHRGFFYLMLIISLSALLFSSLVFNLSGRYRISAWLTTLTMQLGPWGAILLDESVREGDFVPLIYLILSIQLCSVLLSERDTFIIAIVQLGSLVAFLLWSPHPVGFNWTSLVVFMIFSATLGMVTSFTIRKQMEQNEAHRRELQVDKMQLRDLSVRDSVTGLFNRRYMEETLEREIARALRKNQELGIILADIDDFKRINDSFGHAMGDTVLCGVAEILNGSVRNSDVACRYGGDEFILILPECPLAQIMDRAEALRETIGSRMFREGEVDVGKITLSFGIAVVPGNGRRGDEVLKIADDALYAAKREGRNRVKTAGEAQP